MSHFIILLQKKLAGKKQLPPLPLAHDKSKYHSNAVDTGSVSWANPGYLPRKLQKMCSKSAVDTRGVSRT